MMLPNPENDKVHAGLALLRAAGCINHAYAHTDIKCLLPALLLLGNKVNKRLRNLLSLIAKQTYLHREDLSKPREHGTKPHKPMTGK